MESVDCKDCECNVEECVCSLNYLGDFNGL